MRRYNLAVNAAFILLTALLLYHYVDWGYVSQLDFTVVWTYRKALLDGLLITVMLVAVAIPVGLLFGILLAILYQLPFRPTRWLVIMHVEIWRGTPLLVQVFWVHFALPHFTGVNTSPMVSGLIALTLQASAYLTEVVRAGLTAVPVGQVEAALALDLPLLSRWCDIILPQALRVMIPPLANVGLSFLKATTILTALQVGELMTRTNNLISYTFRPVELLTVAGCLYFIMGSGMTFLSRWLEARYKRASR